MAPYHQTSKLFYKWALTTMSNSSQAKTFRDYILLVDSRGTLMDTFTSRTLFASFVTLKIVALMIFGSITHTGTVNGHSDSDLEAYLNLLNKPAIKTMKNEDGDIIDCVDIYKQPAFDHPLLKNHTIHMKPSFVPKMEEDDTSEPVTYSSGQNIESCPQGTVPIRRTQMSDLRRVASLKNYGRLDANGGKIEQAGAMLNDGGPYHGARAGINVWNIPVESNEWSHSAIEISDKDKYYVEAGWTVNPNLFGDGKTRLYTFWTADAYKNTGCYNLLCPGFVQVSQKYALGLEIGPVSTYNGTQHYILTTVYKDNIQLNWWLMINGEPMGYWPAELFGESFEEAWQVKWIGSVLNTGEHCATTLMGSGHFPDEWFGKAAFFQSVRVMDANNNFIWPDDCDFYETSRGCYNVQPVKQFRSKIYFFYGGPGCPFCA